jgi:iron complex outermembrane receptor protein
MIRNVKTMVGSLRAALVAGVGIPFLIATTAFAQAPAAPPTGAAAPATGGEATAERIIVTGSYIPTAESESALPVTIYSAEVLQKSGANTPVEGLRQLPSFVGNASTENDSNAGNGAAFINLRALGQQNVLTLINGRRAFDYADVNAIPISAINNVQVLKDGAGAIYGSDAVAGVVNFQLMNGPGTTPFQGAEVSLLYGNTTDSDAHVRQGWIRGGTASENFSIFASGEYYSRANLFSRDRTIATTGDLGNDPEGLQLGGKNNNSNTFSGRVSTSNNTGTYTGPTGQLVLLDFNNNAPTPADYRPFITGADPTEFNFRAFTPASPAMEKELYYVTARYKVFGDGLQLYGDLMYSKTKQDNGLAASPVALPALPSPYNPFGDNLDSIRYRFVNDLGPRRSFFDRDYYRYVAGANGDFNFQGNDFISHFGYDTGLVYERLQELETDSGDGQFTPLTGEIAAGNFDPFIGQTAPTSGDAPTYTTDAAGNAVPTGLTQHYDNVAAAQRISYLGHTLTFDREWLADVKANAHLFPTLWNGGIDLALGYEHREVDTHVISDPVQAAGDQLGFNQVPPTKTLQKVDSVFGEISLPIVISTMNIPFVRSFGFEFAYRYEKFDDTESIPGVDSASFDNGGTPRLTVRYQPTEDVTLRGSWGQSFESPSPSQLFNPVAQDFPVLFDPVTGVTTQPPDGVWEKGNHSLKPEETDSYSAGIVWTPKFLPNFTMTVDGYQLFTTSLILTPPAAAQILLAEGIVDPDGFGNGSGAVEAPGGPGVGITRFSDGSLDAIDADASNAGKRLVEGMDVTAIYQIPTQNLGTFTLTGSWNHFFIWKAEPSAGLGTSNFLGNYNNGTLPLAPGAIPFNKAYVRGEWEWKGFDFNATGNYIGDYEDDPSFIAGNVLVPSDPGTVTAPNWEFHRRVTDYITLDMQLSYTFAHPPAAEAPTPGYSKESKDSKAVAQTASVSTASTAASFFQRLLWDTKLTVGVNNAFDRNPPTVLGAFNDNYDTSLYSIRNRYYYVSIDKKF